MHLPGHRFIYPTMYLSKDHGLRYARISDSQGMSENLSNCKHKACHCKYLPGRRNQLMIFLTLEPLLCGGGRIFTRFGLKAKDSKVSCTKGSWHIMTPWPTCTATGRRCVFEESTPITSAFGLEPVGSLHCPLVNALILRQFMEIHISQCPHPRPRKRPVPESKISKPFAKCSLQERSEYQTFELMSWFCWALHYERSFHWRFKRAEVGSVKVTSSGSIIARLSSSTLVFSQHLQAFKCCCS